MLLVSIKTIRSQYLRCQKVLPLSGIYARISESANLSTDSCFNCSFSNLRWMKWNYTLGYVNWTTCWSLVLASLELQDSVYPSKQLQHVLVFGKQFTYGRDNWRVLAGFYILCAQIGTRRQTNPFFPVTNVWLGDFHERLDGRGYATLNTDSRSSTLRNWPGLPPAMIYVLLSCVSVNEYKLYQPQSLESTSYGQLKDENIQFYANWL